jgi:protein-S-isoprenylcysteine O-methyltransferase Ste14
MYYLEFLSVLLLFIYNYEGKQFGLLEYFGLIIGLISYVLWIISRIQLGKYFSVVPKAKGLVTSGLYSKIRNPIYVFGSLSILGAILPSRNLFQYSLFIILVIIEVIRSSKEEAVLRKEFGKKYTEYKSKTWF